MFSSAGRGRMLVVTNDFPPRQGGIESFVLAICQRLPPESVVVYTASMPGALEVDASLSFPVLRDRMTTLLPTPGLARRIGQAMREHGCTRVLFGAAAPLGLMAHRLRGYGAEHIVALTHGHEVWWARIPVARSLLRRIGDDVDVLTYVSNWCRDRIAVALSSNAATSMRLLAPGVDPARFRPVADKQALRARLGLPPDGPLIVCVARLVRRKGQDLLVRSLPQLLREHPHLTLVLVGDGPDRRRLARLSRRAGVEPSVRFTGGVPWEQVADFTAAADVFAMPCRTRRGGLEPEAFGIVFLEAQASGVPVVIGRSGGAPETLASPEAGVVVEPSPEEVRRAVSQLLAVPPSLAASDEVACSVHRDHDWQRVAARLLEIFEELDVPRIKEP